VRFLAVVLRAVFFAAVFLTVRFLAVDLRAVFLAALFLAGAFFLAAARFFAGAFFFAAGFLAVVVVANCLIPLRKNESDYATLLRGLCIFGEALTRKERGHRNNRKQSCR